MNNTIKKTGKVNLLRTRRENKPDTLSLRIRTALQITQEEMAARFDPPIHEDTIRRWESGIAEPNKWTLPQLERIAKSANVE